MRILLTTSHQYQIISLKISLPSHQYSSIQVHFVKFSFNVLD